jgi:hypothetical protein
LRRNRKSETCWSDDKTYSTAWLEANEASRSKHVSIEFLKLASACLSVFVSPPVLIATPPPPCKDAKSSKLECRIQRQKCDRQTDTKTNQRRPTPSFCVRQLFISFFISFSIFLSFFLFSFFLLSSFSIFLSYFITFFLFPFFLSCFLSFCLFKLFLFQFSRSPAASSLNQLIDQSIYPSIYLPLSFSFSFSSSFHFTFLSLS